MNRARIHKGQTALRITLRSFRRIAVVMQLRFQVLQGFFELAIVNHMLFSIPQTKAECEGESARAARILHEARVQGGRTMPSANGGRSSGGRCGRLIRPKMVLVPAGDLPIGQCRCMFWLFPELF